MGKTVIKNIRVRCLIGINLDEKKEKQEILISVEFNSDFSKASASDRIADTVNYHDIVTSVISLAENSHFNLIETLADRLVSICLEHKAITWAKVIVQKPKALKSADNVWVEVERTRE